MHTTSGLRKASFVLSTACVGVMAGGTSHAAVLTWDGGTAGTAFATATNWAGDVLPADGDSLVIASATGGVTLPTQLTLSSTTAVFTGTPPTKSFKSITFGTDDTATTTLPAAISVFNGAATALNTSNTIRLTSEADGTVFSVRAGAANSNVTISNGSFGTSSYVLAGATPAANVLNVATAGKFVFFNPVITGTGGLSKTGAGTFFLNNATNNIAGDYFVNAGGLGLGNGPALGATANTVHVASGASLVLDQLSGSFTIDAIHTIDLNGSSTVSVASGETWIANTPVTGNGTLNKTGAGALNLNGPLTYTGGTAVAAGSLYINNVLTSSTTVTSASGTTLGGNGTINGNLAVGGSLLPGSSSAFGTLTVNGNVTLNNGATVGTFRSGLSATDAAADVLTVNGVFDFAEGGGLTVTGLAARNEPVIVLANYGSLAGGAFTTLTGLLGDYTLNYNYNNQKQIALVRGNTKLYYTGQSSGDFATAANFTVDAANTTSTAQYATASSDIYIDNGKPLTNAAATVAATTYVNSLTFGDSGLTASTGFSISQATAGTGSLVIKAAGLNSAAGTGILVTGRSVTNTLNTPVTVANSQSWTNNGAGTLAVTGTVALGTNTLTLSGSGITTVSGVVSGSGALTATGAGTLTLSGTNTYTGVTTLNKSGGALILATTAQAPVITGAGADVRNGGLVLQYTDASLVTTIRGLLAGSYADPATPGVMDTGKLRSGTATASRGLGYADLGGQVIVKSAFFGDADLDGGVSINDFNALAGNFGQASGKVWTDGDFDYDGGVSINDFNLLAGSFGQTLPANGELMAGLLAFAAAHDDLVAFEAVTGVPEPTTLGLVAAGLTLGLRRRRRA